MTNYGKVQMFSAKVFYPLQIVFKHTEHKTTTRSDRDYNTLKLFPVPDASRGPLLGLMTIPIVCIKERGAFSPATVSALARCRKRNLLHRHHEDSTAGLCSLCRTVWRSGRRSCSRSCPGSLPRLLQSNVVGYLNISVCLTFGCLFTALLSFPGSLQLLVLKSPPN